MRPTITSRPLGSAYALPSVALGPYRNHYASLRPAFDPDDDGGGEGGEGGGEPSYAETEYEDEAADADPITGVKPKIKALGFKDDKALVMLPGMKKGVPVKDLMAAFGARTQHEAGLKTMGEIAKAVRQLQQKPQQQGQQRPQQTQTAQAVKDGLEQLEAMDMLDGKSAANVFRQFRDGTVTPMLKAMVQMASEMKELRGHVGGQRQKDTEAEFGHEVSTAIDSLKLPRLDGKPIDGEDVLKEIARDLFTSYAEEDQPKLKGPAFQKLMGERIKSILTFAKNYQKNELELAKRRAKDMRFTRPGANASANGTAKKSLTNRKLADILFAGEEGANV